MKFNAGAEDDVIACSRPGTEPATITNDQAHARIDPSLDVDTRPKVDVAGGFQRAEANAFADRCGTSDQHLFGDRRARFHSEIVVDVEDVTRSIDPPEDERAGNRLHRFVVMQPDTIDAGSTRRGADRLLDQRVE